jgi:uncharacterized protein (DUF1330 family)
MGGFYEKSLYGGIVDVRGRCDWRACNSRSHAQTKPPVYFIVENEISDVRSYLKEYAVHARDMIKANGGHYLAAGDATTYVGEPPKSRVAIFVFDDLQQIQTWLNSPDYKALRAVGEKYAKFRNYAVPGGSSVRKSLAA